MRSGLRFSLLEIVLALAGVGILLAALRFAREATLDAATLATIAAYFFAVVFAVYGRGGARIFAGGFAIGMTLYGATFFFGAMREANAGRYDRSDPPFPYLELEFDTTIVPPVRWLEPLFESQPTYVRFRDETTGETTVWRQLGNNKYLAGDGTTYDLLLPETQMRWKSEEKFPQETVFVAIAHLVWTWAFGYAGSLLARFAHGRKRAIRDPAEGEGG